MTRTTVRPNPCPSCPYRQGVPSGVWAAEEYERLRQYDGTIADQAMAGATAAFGCHQGDGQLCAGWVSHREHPSDLLALRLAAIHGDVDESVWDYRTDVPLFASGAQAAAHGLAEVDAPGEDAAAAIAKITRVRQVRGEPVQFCTGAPHPEEENPCP